MPTKRRKEPGKAKWLWFVHHPEHCLAPVVAENRDMATVAASALWGVPWRTIAADCDVEKRGEACKHLCARCGTFHYDEEDLCAKCRQFVRDEERRIAIAKRRFYREEAIELKRRELIRDKKEKADAL
ncbi:MAG: hypothetical protein J5482_02800 [Oscillospiraceae bacterium]|nr:hypothetical protein [Oscillospiraceae bacterium]